MQQQKKQKNTQRLQIDVVRTLVHTSSLLFVAYAWSFNEQYYSPGHE